MLSNTFAALASPPYRRYWLGSLASVGGVQLVYMAQGLVVFQLSGSALHLGYLGAAASLPNILVSLFGGTLADRLDKRRLLLVTSLIVAAALGIQAWLDWSGQIQVWHVISLAALVAITQGVDWPARSAVFPKLINREHMMSAVALNSIVWQATRMVSPAIGGVLILWYDTWVAFAVGASGFVVMALVLLTLPFDSRPISQGSALSQVAEGFRFVWQKPLFRQLIVLSYLTMLLGPSYVQLMPAFVAALGSNEAGLGVLISTSGVGSIAGTFLVTYWQHHRKFGVMILASIGIAGCALALFALSVSAGPSPWAFWCALPFAFLVSVGSAMFTIAAMTILQLEVPEQLRGRVMGIHAVTFSMMPLGALLIGTLGHILGVEAATLAAALTLIVIAIIAVSTLPTIRHLGGRHAAPAPAAELPASGLRQ